MDPILGQIQAFAFPFAPQGWVICNGQLLNIREYTALFALLGVAYGGDGVNTFGVPDLRGRVPMGWASSGASGITPNYMGQKMGSEYTFLSQLQLPAHTHAASVSGEGGLTGTITATMNVNTSGGESDPNGNYIGTDGGTGMFAADKEAGKALASGAITVNNGLGINLSGLTIAISPTGQQTDPLVLFQPSQVVNYCIAVEGYYPPRS